jgi:MinD-like ATPase involved in chromosome partitioning or flagellar assembly
MTSGYEEVVATARHSLEENARRLGLHGARIHVAAAPFGGLRIRVVHDGLDALSNAKRQHELLQGIEEEIDSAELLTTAEEEWFGPPFTEADEPLPTWSEVLEQRVTADDVHFVTDFDEDIDPPSIVTFYSLRGGVGRTTALAAAARLLAARRRRVLCVDMDFEAPGLPYLFGLSEPGPDRGALPLLLALEQDDDVDIRDHIQRVSDTDELYCLPAGKLSIDYAQRLRLIDPESWYREQPNPLHRLIDLAATSSIAPDIILFDARTGMSGISAPLLFDVSDMAVICFFPHPQAQRGTELLAQSMFSVKTRRSKENLAISPELRFIVAPVPPGPSQAQVRDRALQWIDSWLEQVNERRSPAVGQLQGDELTQVVPYLPEIAFRDKVTVTETNEEFYSPVSDWLEQTLPQPREIEAIEPTSKTTTLSELDFSTGTAEEQQSFIEDFVHTRMSAQALDRRYPLVIGRKGTGKTAIFRWLFEQPSGSIPSVTIMCPNAFRGRVPWAPGSEGFRSIDRRLGETGHGWSTFWACYTALAAALALGSSVPAPAGLDGGILETLRARDIDELRVIDCLGTMLSHADAGLLAARWLRDISASISDPRFLLFDGLDTGFGNDDAGRVRREKAVSGLLTFLTENENRFPNLPFKVMLRFDIWQQLRFENKSHLFGRSLQLVWRDKAEYFKTILKQAMHSPSFKRNLAATQVNQVNVDVDSWTEQEVFLAWNVLVGERMKGGKTAFTRNWVWNRLADGQGDHGPRTLSQLFNSAVDWEKAEQARSPYDRSVLRPRALVPSLENVSEEALSALREEFPELEELIRVLETTGHTPLDAAEVSLHSPEAAQRLDLALEVGLVAVHEGTQDDVRRYRVPDLYRHALGMSRRGQA